MQIMRARQTLAIDDVKISSHFTISAYWFPLTCRRALRYVVSWKRIDGMLQKHICESRIALAESTIVIHIL